MRRRCRQGQIRNRTKSDPAWAYNLDTRAIETVEVYNGELGFVKPHAFDGDKWKSGGFKLERIQVVFTHKQRLWVGYGKYLGKTPKGWWIPLRGLTLVHIECDEIWTFVGKKQARLTTTEKAERSDIGDVYLWTALDANTKLLVRGPVPNRDSVRVVIIWTISGIFAPILS